MESCLNRCNEQAKVVNGDSFSFSVTYTNEEHCLQDYHFYRDKTEQKRKHTQMTIFRFHADAVPETKAYNRNIY